MTSAIMKAKQRALRTLFVSMSEPAELTDSQGQSLAIAVPMQFQQGMDDTEQFGQMSQKLEFISVFTEDLGFKLAKNQRIRLGGKVYELRKPAVRNGRSQYNKHPAVQTWIVTCLP
ncbi:hypothetical protein [Motilimonas cestriensis]|uniref:hypothetical protein n=1 Tax=Motilimonas cestriensis TaxID=2742685 RepID=UPI003DA31CFA